MARYSDKNSQYAGLWRHPKSGIIYYRGTIKGKRFKKSLKTQSLREAKKLADEFVLSLTAENLERAKREAKGVLNPLIKSIWDELIEERCVTRAGATKTTYNRSWIVLSKFWADLQVSDLTDKKVKAFESWFLKNYPDHLFFNYRKHLIMLINYCYKERYISQKPTVQDLDSIVPDRATRQSAFRVYTKKEVDALIHWAVSGRARVAITVFAFTGMRKMELLSRKWSDIDWQGKIINVYSSKNKNWRKVPMVPDVVDALKAWKESEKPQSEDNFIFPTANKMDHISGQIFDKLWVATKERAGIKGQARVHCAHIRIETHQSAVLRVSLRSSFGQVAINHAVGCSNDI